MIMLINIIFTIKDTKLYVPVVTLSVKDTQKLLKLLSKGFERSVYWNEFNELIKIRQMNIDTFMKIKMPILKDLKLEDIIYQKAQ